MWDIYTGQELTDYELHERYDEMLDDVYEEISICGYGYAPSLALKRVDPIAYDCGFNDWLDSEIGETLTETEPERDEE